MSCEPTLAGCKAQYFNMRGPKGFSRAERGYRPNKSLQTLIAGVAGRYPRTRLAQFTTAWDEVQTRFYYIMLNIHHPSRWQEGWPTAWDAWHRAALRGISALAAFLPNYRFYLAAGDYHTILLSDTFYQEQTAGIPFSKWFQAMMARPTSGAGWPLSPESWRNVRCQGCDQPQKVP